jgi:hypothetical protein
MTKQKDRVESLRKEKLHNNFKQLGISTEFVDNFSIRLSKKLSEYADWELKESILKSLKNQMKKRLQGMKSFNELRKFLESISFGSSKINIESIGAIKDKVMINYLLDLLYSCGKLEPKDLKNAKDEALSKFEQMAHLLPVEVKVKRITVDGIDKAEETGYSLATVSFTKRIHDKSWYLTRSKIKTPKLIFDLSTLAAEVFFINSIEQFSLRNIEFYEYKAAEKYVENALSYLQREKVFPLPTDKSFREYLVSILEKYELIPEDVEIIESDQFNMYQRFFRLIMNKESATISNMSVYMISVMTREFVKQTTYVKEKVEREVKEASDYARSFQTKKNINKQTLAVMKDNAFLTKYGYVEIDNDVSLEKFALLEKEFEELTKKIYIPKCDDHSFRIKKLGKHRAAGLYYPDPIRATIFDLDAPDAYCHELGHQLDHVMGKECLLSETIRFRKIADLYESLVENNVKHLDDDHPFKIRWKGNTKYNAAYYLQPTEIFARSFELYLWKKGIQTSFLKKEYEGPEYPKDEKYLKAVTAYFDELFSFFKPEETKKEQEQNKKKHVAAPNTTVKKMEEIQEANSVTHFEQLSLF